MKIVLGMVLLAAMVDASAENTACPADPMWAQTDAAIVAARQEKVRADWIDSADDAHALDADVRETLVGKQATVLRLLDGRQCVTDLSRDDQLLLFNTLESIQAILADAEDSRRVCRRERVVGSNLSQQVCKTVAQIRMERESSERVLRGRDNRCISSCNGDPDLKRPDGW